MSVFVDLESLTLEALTQRAEKLNERLSFAYAAGSGGLIDSLLKHLQLIDAELNFRYAKESAQAWIENSPTIIETDPDLASAHKKEVEVAEADEVIPEVRRRIPTKRSQRPLSPDDL